MNSIFGRASLTKETNGKSQKLSPIVKMREKHVGALAYLNNQLFDKLSRKYTVFQYTGS